MNAIEIGNLSKRFRGMYAVDHLNMTVPVGAIYSFIGENGSGKSTTMKLICGHLVADGGEIKLFGRDHDDPGVRVRVGALIEKRDAFPTPVCAGICVCRPSISGLKILMRRSDACRRSCAFAMACMCVTYLIGGIAGELFAGYDTSVNVGALGAVSRVVLKRTSLV